MTTARPAAPIQLYRMALSGHCHRVELFLSLLGLPCTLVDVDVRAGEHKQPQFLARNPFGQLPVIQDGDVTLADSNAILVYLEASYAPGEWLPREPVAAARVQRWLSVAAGPLAGGPGLARLIVLFGVQDDLAAVRKRAHALLTVMDAQLAAQPFLAGPRPTLADVAMYAYTAHAPEGGVSLQPYAHLRAWLERVRTLPGFVPMVASPVALAE